MTEKIKKIFAFSLIATVVSGFVGICSILYFNLTLPSIDNLGEYRPAIPSQILSSDGEVLLEAGLEKREIAEMTDIPKVIIDAFLAAEDGNFYNHSGIDYFGILRALYKNLKAGRVVQGGSTITQQVAKQVLLTQERSIVRKIKDALLALKIEGKLSKEQILSLYLNKVYLGGGYYGVKAAVQGYFDKSLDEITASEAALLAGLLVAPGKYSPYRNPKFSRDRQAYVLRRMYETNKITKEVFEEAKVETLKLRLRKNNSMKGGHFTDWIRQRVIEKIGKESFLSDGYKIVTTLDWSLQKIAEQEVDKGLRALDKRQGFKGPIDHYASDEQILEEEINFRTKRFKGESNFFDLTPEGERIYELSYDEEKFQEIRNFQKESREQSRFKYFVAGNSSEDDLIPLIKIDKRYKAIVIKVDNPTRMVYVSLGGVRGIIPYDGFKWAHKRVISESKNLLPYVTRPSTILKRGDVVEIKVIGKQRSAYSKFWNAYKDRLKNKEIIKSLKTQKFFLCDLDQTPDVEGSLIALNPADGSIISMVGGRDFFKSQFNRALQSQRQPGSAFKPILYAAGLENGFTPADLLLDTPEALGGVDASLNWKPRNYDGKFKGPITFRRSLETSRNVPTIKMVAKVGVPKVFEFLNRIGFKAKMDADLSISLGSFGMTLLDLVTSYGIFPNKGQRVVPRSINAIVDGGGNEVSLEEYEKEYYQFLKDEEVFLAQNGDEVSSDEQKKNEVGEESNNDSMADSVQPEPIELTKEEKKLKSYLESLDFRQVYDIRLSYIMSNLMKGIIQNGTGRGARMISPFIGGKTGTTNNYVDAWFIGFSSNIALGVWTGFDDNSTLGWGETGAKSALPIWKGYMAEALKKYGEFDFPAPKGIINVAIDKESGKISDGDIKNRFMEAFVEGTQPRTESERDEVSDKAVEEINPDEKDFAEDDDFFDS